MTAIATTLLGILAGVLSLAATVPARAQISDDVVKLGVLSDMSSLYSEAAGKGSVTAVEMAVADYGGTVKGKPIKVISADHQNKPDVGVGVARNWYDNEQVDVVLDVPNSSVALAVQDLTREKNKLLIISGSGSSDLTGKACSPNGIQWTYDTYALANVAGRATVTAGDDTWFFITADYAFGAALERDASEVVEAGGGKVIGSVRHPLNASDFSSLLLQAQASKAKVVALANAGGDTSTAIRQAAGFGLGRGGQKLLALLMQITDAHAIGLKEGRGLLVTDGFYWDLNDGSRAFAKAFFDKTGRMPTMIQAGLYSATLHYLKAIDQSGTDEAQKVVAQMKATPVNDFFAQNGKVREDGRMVHDMYLFELKAPEESKSEWDLYKLIATVPGDQAFRPLDQGGCPLVR
ncbi:MAG: ABC transporter permease [Proteobacteria bacterium]|nr:MAG: ABC transporter permease [Pseudomonadota bacterium]